jgi:hypothetical protein
MFEVPRLRFARLSIFAPLEMTAFLFPPQEPFPSERS